jgi:6-phosphofructokinase 1
MAVEFVTFAVDKILEQDSNDGLVIVHKDGKFDFVTIDYVNSSTYTIKPTLLCMAKNLTK